MEEHVNDEVFRSRLVEVSRLLLLLLELCEISELLLYILRVRITLRFIHNVSYLFSSYARSERPD